MKAIDNVKTDDLNEEQKRLLAELIKNEMLSAIESAVKTGAVSFADTIKTYLRQDADIEQQQQQQPAATKK